ncbi:hypothetical protein BJF83_06370 [Nocardiopsis sp. CNR-923]|nr:hypothetical protein BJF83_06370 [Nocardiopsis sp. CNR-923]
MPGAVALDDERLGDGGVVHQGGFHLGGFDAYTPDLDLPVGPAQHLQRAVRAPDGQITGPVLAPSHPVRGGDEPRRGPGWVPHVPQGESRAADHEFTGGPVGDGTTVLVQDARGDAG